MYLQLPPPTHARQSYWRTASLILGSFLLGSPACADESVQLILGVDYISNVEGEQGKLDLIATSLMASYRIERLRVKISIPYLVEANAAESAPADPGAKMPSPQPFRSGIGDTNVYATYSAPIAANLWLDVTGKVKFPTAVKTARLGTGSTDWSLQGEVTRYIGNSGISVRAGKKFTGVSELYDLANPTNLGVGAFSTFGGTTVAMDYDRRGSSFKGGIERDEVTLSLSQALTPTLRLQAYGYVSILGGRSDVGLGSQVVVRFGS